MEERALIFKCNGDDLVGILHGSFTGRQRIGVLVVVGGPQYRVGSHRQFVLMARQLAAAGYCVLRFDYRGMGDSVGEKRTFEDVDADIHAALDAFQTEEPGIDRFVIFGLCDAASAALLYCRTDARVRGLILANPWVRTEVTAAKTAVRHYYGQRLLQRSFWSKVLSGRFRPRDAIREFLASVRTAGNGAMSGRVSVPTFIERMQAGFEQFTGPMLLLLSDRDLTAREFEEVCGSSAAWRECISATGIQRRTVRGDHTFSSVEAMVAVSGMVADWLGRIGQVSADNST